jgi:hypothetical protein
MENLKQESPMRQEGLLLKRRLAHYMADNRIDKGTKEGGIERNVRRS